jgi:glycosyltransferase involved in cell wall biosynthesis
MPSGRSTALFLPAWNEASNLPRVVARADAHLARGADPYTLIVVDDGSTDDTASVLAALQAGRPHLHSVRHQANRGYGSALRTGFHVGLATGHEWIAYCDADGQFDPADLDRLLDAAEAHGADLAIGYRVRRADRLSRRVLGHGWHLVSRVVLGVRARDVDCGFKVIRRDALAELAPELVSDYATISPELLVRAQRHGLRVVEVPLAHAPREAGESSGANVAVIVGSVRSLWALRRTLRRPAAPARELLTVKEPA